MFSSTSPVRNSSVFSSDEPLPLIDSHTWPDYMVGQKDSPVKAFLVDDDVHIRRVIAQDLMNDPRTLLVGQAASLKEARKSVLLHPFDVLLLDLNLGDGDGIDLLDFVHEKLPKVLSIIISVTEREDRVFQAFHHGAQGFLLKNSWFGDYSTAVLQVANGGVSITPSLAKSILDKIKKTHNPIENSIQYIQSEKLSHREVEILEMISCGYSNPEISRMLTISTATVSTHIKNIYRKLQVHSKAHAVRAASLRGLL